MIGELVSHPPCSVSLTQLSFRRRKLIAIRGNGERYETTWGEIWAEQPGFPLHLNEAETWWRDRYNMLLRRGYKLLPRYSPDWKPSWIKKYDSSPDYTALKAKCSPDKYEDAVAMQPRGSTTVPLMYATRLLDGVQVAIKRVGSLGSEVDEELKTMILVSSDGLRDDPMNHCVSLLEWFPIEDDDEPHLNNDNEVFAVMPLLRDWRQPSFSLAIESLDFVSQLLEGLVFMHKNNIAHGDIRADNVCMDPSTMFPSGMNPLVNQTPHRYRRPREPLDGKDRIDVSVKYLFIDFGESVSFPSFEERRISRPARSRHLYPEMFDDKNLGQREPWHDPFPRDIYVMGTVLLKSFASDLPFLWPLIDSMLEWDPKARPTAMQCLERFQDAKLRLRRSELLSPAANKLHPHQSYDGLRHRIKDIVTRRSEYSRLRAKAAQLLDEQSTLSAT